MSPASPPSLPAEAGPAAGLRRNKAGEAAVLYAIPKPAIPPVATLRSLFMRLRLVPATLALLLLAACATPTPFKAAGPSGADGYSVQQLESNRFLVNFAGNTTTPRQTVETYLLYLSAEITVQNGFDYFVLNEKSLDKSVNYQTYDTGFFGRRRGFGGGFDTSYTTPYSAYDLSAEILLFKGAKPAQLGNAYDAHDLAGRLAPQIIRTTPPIGPY